MPKGYMYILACNDGSYYIGSTKYLAICFMQHALGKGASYTKTRLPVKLVYVEAYDNINKAFYREKEVQDWSRKKKEVLIAEMQAELNELATYTNKIDDNNS